MKKNNEMKYNNSEFVDIKDKYHAPDMEDIKLMYNLIHVKLNNICLIGLIGYLLITLISWWEYKFIPNAFNVINYLPFENGIEFIAMILLNIVFIYLLFKQYKFFKNYKSDKCLVKYSTLVRCEYKYGKFQKNYFVTVKSIEGNELEYELDYNNPLILNPIGLKPGTKVMIVKINKKETAFILKN